MKKVLFLLAVMGHVGAFMQSAGADLYVVQVGDGSAALSNASTATFIKRFDDTGMLLSTINLPTETVDSHKPLTLSGTSTSEGFLALSTNGQYLTLGGYGIGPGTPTVPQTNSADVNRVIGRIELSSGNVDTTTALTDAYNANNSTSNSNIRSVVSTDGTKFWSTGTAVNTAPESAGIRYSEFGGTTSTRVASAPTNTRVAKIFDGQLYMSSASGSTLGVLSVGTGLPETEETATLLNGFPTVGINPNYSSYDFWFKDANTLYVADDRAPTNGGIEKWELADGTWSRTYTLNLGGSGFGARGLAGTIIDGNAVLFATTTQTSANRLMMITDLGPSSTPTELAAAPTFTAFRGLAYVPSSVDPPTELTGDYNDDGVVDAADYVVWRDNLDSFADLNGDLIGGQIGTGQYDQWRANFGATPPGSGSSTAIPEPATIGLLLMGFALAALRRRN